MELVNWFTSFMNKKWSHRIINLIEEFSIGCDVVKNFGTLVKVSIYSMLIWIGNILYVYPLYFAFGLENKTITFSPYSCHNGINFNYCCPNTWFSRLI